MPDSFNKKLFNLDNGKFHTFGEFVMHLIYNHDRGILNASILNTT
jgi:hypothetical protein